MIYIDNSQLRRTIQQDDLDALNAANAHLQTLDEQGRKDYISGNSAKWSAIKSELWNLGHLKCWYSEAKLQRDQGEVEHFRPKNKVAKVQHSGYWWRAFDWDNYRLAHPTVNKRVTDYLTGMLAGKGTYFPLKNEVDRATDRATEANEEPVLLDPCNHDECELISYDSSNGKPIPKYKAEDNEWLHHRAEMSIAFYHLDEGTWNAARQDLMKDVETLCDEIIAEYKKDPNGLRYIELRGELLECLSPYAEFTSAAAQVAREKGVL